jgi:hypothetical protein
MDFDYQPFPPSTLYDPEHPGGAAFLSFVNAWIELAGMLNELSRSMGQPDFYPSCCRRRRLPSCTSFIW